VNRERPGPPEDRIPFLLSLPGRRFCSQTNLSTDETSTQSFLAVSGGVIDHPFQPPTSEDNKTSMPLVYLVKVNDARFDSPPDGGTAFDSDGCRISRYGVRQGLREVISEVC
jgi:hypothetical protein